MLVVKPCTLAQANELVDRLHRHHDPCTGHRFSLSVWESTTGRLVGVAICGRPVACRSDQDAILEISRCATDGTPNAISKLYGAVCKVAKIMGFHSVQTFTLPSEGGASMRASGFEFAGVSKGGKWQDRGDGSKRNRGQPTGPKHKWVKRFPENENAFPAWGLL